MSDDLSRKGESDQGKVNVGETWERNYWCKALGVTEEKLKEAVSAVGPGVDAVRKYLGKSL